MGTDSAAALARFSRAIAADDLTSPESSDPEWDTYALLAAVSNDADQAMRPRPEDFGGS